MILCRDCKHYTPESITGYDCAHPKNMEKDPVRGGTKQKYLCRQLRSMDTECGPEGAWFDPKPQSD